ncbi:hypothetical protein MCOR07_006082 [Pyricularia oryzae]|uniref:Uncharacterized protein n=2 Tax=Pyricularia TaxID=48558 RepID=A0ABQ8NXH6_PYRGI|nr:hypothetical protein MCOR01_002517 [Pyricularia oryzae]KAI6303569.1 hypothetical protein MCOR33_001262 [Pyricularia grisea]KAI6254335.1 hypothetical protein MCOR19_009150 [Pyricularia oryzae]KAI6274028.1 hypothetical protein MCOR26_006658 [Pyricularia oryzae]KAI6299575.1 hypothetical protein MCOR34_009159 [Pyricularia oryzae]
MNRSCEKAMRILSEWVDDGPRWHELHELHEVAIGPPKDPRCIRSPCYGAGWMAVSTTWFWDKGKIADSTIESHMLVSWTSHPATAYRLLSGRNPQERELRGGRQAPSI